MSSDTSRIKKAAITTLVTALVLSAVFYWVRQPEGADRAAPLVIDPVQVYSTCLGGGQVDAGRAIAVDNVGNAYICSSHSAPCGDGFGGKKFF